MIQVLQGVKVIPQGSNNRFSAQNWPNSYAFGGWIYNISTSIGFNEKPTEIKMSVVLETKTFSQTKAKFDIQESDLHCDAGNGGLANESWFDFDMEGVLFKNFLLYSYDFSIENEQKILNVIFKDYSVILDKIYVGLFKKQGYKYPHSLNCQIELPIRCMDCEYTGGAVTGSGYAERDIGFGCYVGINGQTYDLFDGSFYSKKNVFQEWQDKIINSTSKAAQFDLNGGYLIIGTESATEERCNSAPNITYSFIEMLGALRRCGLNFVGEFPSGTIDSDFVYRTSHNGSLREVLQNWCSDLGYTFFVSGRSLVGMNLKNPIDITDITKLADPTSDAGKFLQIDSENTALTNFNVKTSLDNTFRQAVVVDNSYPITQRNVSKSVKRYIGITPLHPISLNEIYNGRISDKNVYGTEFQRRAFETPWFDSGNGVNVYFANFARLDGRSFADVDAAIALSRYNDTLRDLYVAQRALFNAWNFNGNLITDFEWRPDENVGQPAWPMNNAYCRANFAALGMFPILEITDSELKSNIIFDNFQKAETNGISNINIDQQYFRVFLGYYYPDLKNEITSWEKTAAASMYKYGIVTNGILTEEPFIPPNLNSDISPTEGFYGSEGLVYTRIENSFTPNTDRYADVKFAPFSDVLLYSGYVRSKNTGTYYNNNNQYNPFIPPGFSDYAGRLPTGLWVSSLDNDWGIGETEFNRTLSFNLSDPCAENYTLDQGVNQILTESDQTLQDWSLDYFKPIVNPDLSTIYEIIQSDEFNFDNVVDNVLEVYSDYHFIKKKECKKLHILIIPDTRIHPNIDVRFTPKVVNKINNQVLKMYKQKLYEADLKKNTSQTPSICSISLLEEMCRSAFTGSGYNTTFSPPLTSQKSGCVILEDKNNYFLDGFQKDVLFKPNSRSLDISITKNPDRREISPTMDLNGDYYYSDLDLGMLILDTATVNTSIVYPIQSFPNSVANYSGIYDSNIQTEFRLPAFTKVYGEPVNIANNNTSSFKLVNNTVDDTLNPILDPFTNKVKSFVTVLDGVGNSIIKTPEEYYNYIKNLNNYNLTVPMKEVSMTLAGSPNNFGSFISYLNPQKGLQQITLSVTDNGVKTDLVFGDRPKVLPKQEAILNKIGPRIKGVY